MAQRECQGDAAWKMRAVVILVSAVLVVGVSAGCGTSASVASPSSSTTPRSFGPTSVSCVAPVVALDPGHNPVRLDTFDPKTGVAQIDYPNGAEDTDVFSVARQVSTALRARGYRVVLLKRAPTESVSYRQRVDRAEAAHAAIGVSIHTSPGVNAVFVQRVGLYREGVTANGKTLRVDFTDRATAALSQRYGALVARERTRAEGHAVSLQDNDFGGRAPLWSGNIPIISLIATHTPWVYNEFSPGTSGGSIPVDAGALRTYARGIADGVQGAVPRRC